MSFILNAKLDECTGRYNLSDNIVCIRCTCQACKKKSTKTTTKTKGIDISEQFADKNAQVLEQVEPPFSNTNCSMPPVSVQGVRSRQ
jgi:hypothetical protein